MQNPSNDLSDNQILSNDSETTKTNAPEEKNRYFTNSASVQSNDGFDRETVTSKQPQKLLTPDQNNQLILPEQGNQLIQPLKGQSNQLVKQVDNQKTTNHLEQFLLHHLLENPPVFVPGQQSFTGDLALNDNQTNNTSPSHQTFDIGGTQLPVLTFIYKTVDGEKTSSQSQTKQVFKDIPSIDEETPSQSQREQKSEDVELSEENSHNTVEQFVYSATGLLDSNVNNDNYKLSGFLTSDGLGQSLTNNLSSEHIHVDGLELIVVEDTTGQIVQDDLLDVNSSNEINNETVIQNSILQEKDASEMSINAITSETVENTSSSEVEQHCLNVTDNSNNIHTTDRGKIHFYEDGVDDEINVAVVYTADMLNKSRLLDHNYISKILSKRVDTPLEDTVLSKKQLSKKGKMQKTKTSLLTEVEDIQDVSKTNEGDESDNEMIRNESADCVRTDTDNNSDEQLSESEQISDSNKKKVDSDEDWSAPESENSNDSDADSFDSLFGDEEDSDEYLGSDVGIKDTIDQQKHYFTRRMSRKNTRNDDGLEKEEERSEDKKDNFECQSCGHCFDDEEQYESHVCSKENEETPGVLHTCEQCSKQFKKAFKLKQHMKKYHGYICKVCSAGLPSAYQLKQHVVCNHTMRRPFRCGICSEMSKGLCAIARHFQYHHPEEEIFVIHTCEACGESFKDREKFENHLETHPDLFLKKTCSVCQKVLRLKGSLIEHMKREHVNFRPYICHVCAKGFFEIGDLKEHIKEKHTSDHETFSEKCPHCPKEFTRKKAWKKHIITHTLKKDIICDLCGRRYSTKNALKQHAERRHNEAGRTAECKICHKMYFGQINLNRHMKVHTGKRTGNIKKESGMGDLDNTGSISKQNNNNDLKRKKVDNKEIENVSRKRRKQSKILIKM